MEEPSLTLTEKTKVLLGACLDELEKLAGSGKADSSVSFVKDVRPKLSGNPTEKQLVDIKAKLCAFVRQTLKTSEKSLRQGKEPYFTAVKTLPYLFEKHLRNIISPDEYNTLLSELLVIGLKMMDRCPQPIESGGEDQLADLLKGLLGLICKAPEQDILNWNTDNVHESFYCQSFLFCLKVSENKVRPCSEGALGIAMDLYCKGSGLKYHDPWVTGGVDVSECECSDCEQIKSVEGTADLTCENMPLVETSTFTHKSLEEQRSNLEKFTRGLVLSFAFELSTDKMDGTAAIFARANKFIVSYEKKIDPCFHPHPLTALTAFIHIDMFVSGQNLDTQCEADICRTCLSRDLTMDDKLFTTIASHLKRQTRQTRHLFGFSSIGEDKAESYVLHNFYSLIMLYLGSSFINCTGVAEPQELYVSHLYDVIQRCMLIRNSVIHFNAVTPQPQVGDLNPPHTIPVINAQPSKQQQQQQQQQGEEEATNISVLDSGESQLTENSTTGLSVASTLQGECATSNLELTATEELSEGSQPPTVTLSPPKQAPSTTKVSKHKWVFQKKSTRTDPIGEKETLPAVNGTTPSIQGKKVGIAQPTPKVPNTTQQTTNPMKFPGPYDSRYEYVDPLMRSSDYRNLMVYAWFAIGSLNSILSSDKFFHHVLDSFYDPSLRPHLGFITEMVTALTNTLFMRRRVDGQDLFTSRNTNRINQFLMDYKPKLTKTIPTLAEQGQLPLPTQQQQQHQTTSIQLNQGPMTVNSQQLNSPKTQDVPLALDAQRSQLDLKAIAKRDKEDKGVLPYIQPSQLKALKSRMFHKVFLPAITIDGFSHIVTPYNLMSPEQRTAIRNNAKQSLPILLLDLYIVFLQRIERVVRELVEHEKVGEAFEVVVPLLLSLLDGLENIQNENSQFSTSQNLRRSNENMLIMLCDPLFSLLSVTLNLYAEHSPNSLGNTTTAAIPNIPLLVRGIIKVFGRICKRKNELYDRLEGNARDTKTPINDETLTMYDMARFYYPKYTPKVIRHKLKLEAGAYVTQNEDGFEEYVMGFPIVCGSGYTVNQVAFAPEKQSPPQSQTITNSTLYHFFTVSLLKLCCVCGSAVPVWLWRIGIGNSIYLTDMFQLKHRQTPGTTELSHFHFGPDSIVPPEQGLFSLYQLLFSSHGPLYEAVVGIKNIMRLMVRDRKVATEKKNFRIDKEKYPVLLSNPLKTFIGMFDGLFHTLFKAASQFSDSDKLSQELELNEPYSSIMIPTTGNTKSPNTPDQVQPFAWKTGIHEQGVAEKGVAIAGGINLISRSIGGNFRDSHPLNISTLGGELLLSILSVIPIDLARIVWALVLHLLLPNRYDKVPVSTAPETSDSKDDWPPNCDVLPPEESGDDEWQAGVDDTEGMSTDLPKGTDEMALNFRVMMYHYSLPTYPLLSKALRLCGVIRPEPVDSFPHSIAGVVLANFRKFADKYLAALETESLESLRAIELGHNSAYELFVFDEEQLAKEMRRGEFPELFIPFIALGEACGASSAHLVKIINSHSSSITSEQWDTIVDGVPMLRDFADVICSLQGSLQHLSTTQLYRLMCNTSAHTADPDHDRSQDGKVKASPHLRVNRRPIDCLLVMCDTLIHRYNQGDTAWMQENSGDCSTCCIVLVVNVLLSNASMLVKSVAAEGLCNFYSSGHFVKKSGCAVKSESNTPPVNVNTSSRCTLDSLPDNSTNQCDLLTYTKLMVLLHYGTLFQFVNGQKADPSCADQLETSPRSPGTWILDVLFPPLTSGGWGCADISEWQKANSTIQHIGQAVTILLGSPHGHIGVKQTDNTTLQTLASMWGLHLCVLSKAVSNGFGVLNHRRSAANGGWGGALGALSTAQLLRHSISFDNIVTKELKDLFQHPLHHLTPSAFFDEPLMNLLKQLTSSFGSSHSILIDTIAGFKRDILAAEDINILEMIRTILNHSDEPCEMENIANFISYFSARIPYWAKGEWHPPRDVYQKVHEIVLEVLTRATGGGGGDDGDVVSLVWLGASAVLADPNTPSHDVGEQAAMLEKLLSVTTEKIQNVQVVSEPFFSQLKRVAILMGDIFEDMGGPLRRRMFGCVATIAKSFYFICRNANVPGTDTPCKAARHNVVCEILRVVTTIYGQCLDVAGLVESMRVCQGTSEDDDERKAEQELQQFKKTFVRCLVDDIKDFTESQSIQTQVGDGKNKEEDEIWSLIGKWLGTILGRLDSFITRNPTPQQHELVDKLHNELWKRCTRLKYVANASNYLNIFFSLVSGTYPQIERHLLGTTYDCLELLLNQYFIPQMVGDTKTQSNNLGDCVERSEGKHECKGPTGSSSLSPQTTNSPISSIGDGLAFLNMAPSQFVQRPQEINKHKTQINKDNDQGTLILIMEKVFSASVPVYSKHMFVPEGSRLAQVYAHDGDGERTKLHLFRVSQYLHSIDKSLAVGSPSSCDSARSLLARLIIQCSAAFLTELAKT